MSALIVNVNTGNAAHGPGSVDGEEIVRGVVQAELGRGKLRVWIPDVAGLPNIVEVVRRDPSDYGDEGGGLTWFPA